ncbi:MAG: PIN domain-containing protein [Pseudomonadota bacterium]
MKKETWCFIDFENLPSALEYAIGNDYARIFVFLGSQQKKVNIDLSKAMTVNVIKIEGVGKNNLDFHLIYYLGKCQVNAGNHVEFAVFSKDTGWDRLIQFIQKEGRTCQRITTTGSLNKSVQKANIVQNAKPPIDVQPILTRLKKLNKAQRPKRVDRLTNHLQSIIRSLNTTKTAKQIVDILKQQGLISVDGNKKITYTI